MASRLTYTFDNGPWPGATDRLLDFLAEREIKATFFAVGERLADPDARRCAERAAAEGHWIGNHTLTHGTPLGEDGGTGRVEREIGETERMMGTLAHPRRFFRPNGGGRLGRHLLSQAALDYLSGNRYTVVTWNAVPGDWQPPHRQWIDSAMADLARHDWPVLVLHDEFIADMLDTLARFHDRLIEAGVEIVQDFNPDCIAVERGELRPHAAEITTE